MALLGVLALFCSNGIGFCDGSTTLLILMLNEQHPGICLCFHFTFTLIQNYFIETIGFSALKTRSALCTDEKGENFFHTNKHTRSLSVGVRCTHCSFDTANGIFDYLQFIHAYQIKWCNLREFMYINYALHCRSMLYFGWQQPEWWMCQNQTFRKSNFLSIEFLQCW